MENLDSGHLYTVRDYAPDNSILTRSQRLFFVKKVGSAYPGNKTASNGTNCQELIRVLIDRVDYLNRQKPCLENYAIVGSLRLALWLFEFRAARIKGKLLSVTPFGIEKLPTSPSNGHLECWQKK